MKREELIIFLEWYSKYRERGFDAEHIEYIADLYLSTLPDEKEEIICCYCNERPVLEPLWICRECMIAYNKEKQTDR